MLPRLRYEHILLLFILLTGLFLRLYRLDDLSLTNDDLSALSRLQYDSFSELIEYGVTPDGHPAGVQVFLYYWTKAFGDGEMALHVPFIFMGMLSIALGYWLGKRWFSTSCGLSMAVALAVWQYPLAHSLSIRPYLPGLVGILGMALCWTSLLQTPKERPWLNRMGYVVLGLMACYSHYFSLLEAALLALTGFLFLQKSNRTPYLMSTAAIGLLYLPHIPIFLSQLEKGGVGGWLGPPAPDFLFRYFDYLLHFSGWMWGMVLGLTGLTIFYTFRHQQEKSTLKRIHYQIIALILFVLPLGIGWAYSVWVNPVLHYQVLFFAFPFLLMLLFSMPCSLSNTWQAVVTGLFLIVSVGTLIGERQHFQVFYNRGPKAIIQQQFQQFQQSQQSSPFLFQVNQPFYAQYYRDRIAPELKIDRYEVPADYTEFRNWVSHLPNSTFTLAWANRMIPWEYVQMTREYYPYLKEKQLGVVSESYVFTQENMNADPYPFHFESSLSFENEGLYWSEMGEMQEDSVYASAPYGCRLDFSSQFSPAFAQPLSQITSTPFDILEAEVSVLYKNSLPKDASLAITFERKGEILAAQYMPLRRWVAEPNKWFKVYHSIRLRHLPLVYDDKTQVKVYVWNPEGQELFLDDFGVRTVPGNRYLYGWIEPIPK